MPTRILIVDDSPTARLILCRHLPEDLEFEVFQAEDGEKGVAAFKKERPDLVLLDLTMPIMSGFEALKEILSIDPEAQVIIVTADVQQEARRRVLEIGAAAVINKPIKAKEIDAIIRAHI